MNNLSQPLANKWYYVGNDGLEYGPHSSTVMMDWVQTGQLPNTVLLRLENDAAYYPIHEWIRRCGNKLPFLFLFDATNNGSMGINRDQFLQEPNHSMLRTDQVAVMQQYCPAVPVPPPNIVFDAHGMLQSQSGRVAMGSAAFSPLFSGISPHPNIAINYPTRLSGMIQQPMQFPVQHNMGITGGESTTSISPVEEEHMNRQFYHMKIDHNNQQTSKGYMTKGSLNLSNRGTSPAMLIRESVACQTDLTILPVALVEHVLSTLYGINVKISST
ncbi:GYF domain-containing protein [Ditylenchus destructor]|nr:GYF domain-containing protein [Ditylenchus destructor]